MLKDLRNIFSKIAIKVNPSDCRSKDVHLLLSDYLYKELKMEGIDVKRNNVNLIVSFKNNTNLVIDCLDGHLYMRGDNLNKQIGKLRRFNMNRSGEVYDCAVQNAQRIINKIKSIQQQINNDNVIFKKASLIDKRTASDVDIYNRESAIVVINGIEVLEYETHAAAVSGYLKSIGCKPLNDTYYRFSIFELNKVKQNPKAFYGKKDQETEDLINIAENIDSLAFAHLMDDYTIRLETDSLWNCNVNDIALILKETFPDYDILDDNNIKEKKLAIKDLRAINKQADITQSRESAIVVINNVDIVESNTHASAINNYLSQHGAEPLNDTYYRVTTQDLETPIESLKERLNYVSEATKNSLEDVIDIKENINSLAFAHKMKDYTIRLETDTLWNCNVNDIALILKQNYSDYEILDDNSWDRKRLAIITDKRLKKMSILNDLRTNKKIITSDLRVTKKIILDLRR